MVKMVNLCYIDFTTIKNNNKLPKEKIKKGQKSRFGITEIEET